LGFGDVVDTVQQASFGSNYDIPILLDNLFCRGNEDRLHDCTARVGNTSHNCAHVEDAGLICRDASKQLYYINSLCSNSVTGLADGDVSYEGRVEVFRNGAWSTVCDDLWDQTDADVFCRQVGYPGAEFSYGLAEFGQGSGTIQLRNLRCTGTENSILDCSFSTDANIACSHSEDAGVRCLRNISE